eukprot:TRINITY_DN6529_c0_g1_i1.p1 TRINITY_DN6529_c0_g1~~TRINITY_DN6529_c0_g1_i1.p1  ORF type:complete len:687 (-),score=185.41 TRINITY_DN6529_c0_g1_i1:48-2108(-)
MDYGLSEVIIAIAIIVIVGFCAYFFLGSTPTVTGGGNTGRVTGKVEKKDKENKETKERGSGEDGKDNKPKVKILWGSQTGTAEDFSNTLNNELKALGIQSESIDMEEFEDSYDLTEGGTFVLVAATYGEGEPTDNAKRLFDWLEEESDESALSKVDFTVFGLGNKTYDQYNSAGRFLDTRIAALGGNRFYPHGEGDDDSNLEEEWMLWKRELLPALCSKFSLPYNPAAESAKLTRKTKLQYYPSFDNSKLNPHPLVKSETLTTTSRVYTQQQPFFAEVISHNQLHSDTSDRSCFHVEFKIPTPTPISLQFAPGDHLGIFPENAESLVQAMENRFGGKEEFDKVASLFPLGKAGKAIWGPTRIRDAFRFLLDLTTPPRKSALAVLANYTKDEDQKRRLQILASTDEKELPESERYENWVRGTSRRGMVDIIQYFNTCEIPLDYFIEILQPLAPRYYSISSSRSLEPDRVSVTLVVVSFDIADRTRVHDGVCSGFMGILNSERSRRNGGWRIGHKIPIFLRKNPNFKLPKDPSVPVIMIGPGTGLAPFRGFILERKVFKEKNKDKPVGEMLLFFGCRNSKHDFLYEQQLRDCEKEGVVEVKVAFSREEGVEKQYVQDKLREESQRVWEMMDKKKGHIYICGDANKMAPDVRKELVRLVQKEGGKTEKEAEEYVAKMVSDGRFATDVWH